MGYILNHKLLKEGKSKKVYAEDDNTLILEFKDEVTAFDGARRDIIPGKGVLNARLSAEFFKLLEEAGIPTHFIKYDGCRSIFVKKLEMIPLEIIVRNYAYGSLLKRMPLFKPLKKLKPPTVEFHYKDDALHDPLILPEDALKAGLVSVRELEEMFSIALKVNDALSSILSRKKLRLVDFKIEVGRDHENKLLVADELTGDAFRVLDEKGRHLDKEVYRKGGSPRDLFLTYLELARKLGLEVKEHDLRC